MNWFHNREIRSKVNPAYLLLFTLFFASRLLFVLTLPEILTTPDSYEYLALADSLQEGRFYYEGKPESFRTPGYPFFLAIILAAFPDSFRMVAAFQALLSALEAVLVFSLVHRFWNNQAGFYAYFILLLNPGGWHCVTSILTEPLFSCTVVVLIWVYMTQPFDRRVNYFLCGLLCGVSALVRPISVWLFIPLTLLICWDTGKFKPALRNSAIFLAAIFLTQGAWVSRNYAHYQSIYFSEITAANVYVYWAQAVLAEEKGESIDPLILETWDEWQARRRELSPPQMLEYFNTKGMAILKERKAHALLVAVKGAFRQIIESGFTRFLSRYTPELPLKHADIIQQVLHPESVGLWVLYSSVLAFRFLEISVVMLLFVASFSLVAKTVFQVMCNREAREQHRLILLGGIILFYLYLLSSGPAAGVRFREQYFPVLVLLGVAVLLQSGRCLRSSRSMIV